MGFDTQILFKHFEMSQCIKTTVIFSKILFYNSKLSMALT